MPTQVAHHTIVISLAMLLDGIADVAHETPGLGSLHAYLEALLGHTHQLCLLGTGLADDEHARRVGIVAIQDGGEIYVDDVAFLENVGSLRYAVTHHFVDACADTLRETFIVQAGRDGIVLLAVFHADVVNLQSRHSCMNILCHFVEHAGVHHTSSTDALYLLGCLNQIARRNQFAPAFPVHYFFVEFRGSLSRQATPTSFLHNSNFF